MILSKNFISKEKRSNDRNDWSTYKDKCNNCYLNHDLLNLHGLL